MMNNRFYAVLCGLVALCLTAGAEVISVQNQRDFIALGRNIQAAVSNGERDIVVEFEKDVYLFRENHINLQHKDWPEVSITLVGNGALIMANGGDYGNGDALEKGFEQKNGFVTPEGRLVPMWGDLHQAQQEVEVVNEGEKLCRLKYTKAPQMKAEECENVYIHVTQWFKSNVYKVQRIDKGWIYFTVNDLSYNSSYKCQSINLDYGYGKMMPRFRLCNVPGGDENLICVKGDEIALPKGVDEVHECHATSFLNLAYTNLKNFSMRGFHFAGNKDAEAYLLNVKSCKMGAFSVAECEFEAIRSGVIQVTYSNNIKVEKCRFSDCFRHGVYCTYDTNITIADNEFRRMGLGIQNTFSVRCDGQNYLVKGNIFEDFGYGGIAVGQWWASEKKVLSRGVVEQNKLFFNEDYMASILKRGLMDSGAIYLYTQNDDADVRYNFICNYNGAYDNRGIFCDDGACNFKIHANIIVNTPNGHSIDSRRTASIERNQKSFIHTVNVNNQIYDNLIDGSVRFQGRENASTCSLDDNYQLDFGTNSSRADNSPRRNDVLGNLRRQSNFIVLTSPGIIDHTLRLQHNTYTRLARKPWFDKINQWIDE